MWHQIICETGDDVEEKIQSMNTKVTVLKLENSTADSKEEK